MTYEEFLDTELCAELAEVEHSPHMGIAYGSVTTPFSYRGEIFYPGSRVAYHLDDGMMRCTGLVDTEYV